MQVSDTQLRARVDYVITDRQLAYDLRERFDADADRRLSGEEQARLQKYLVGEALRPLHVVLNGEAVALELIAATTSGLGDRLPSSYPITVVIALRAKLKIVPEFNTIRISDYDARAQSESILGVSFPKAFRLQVETRPEVVVSGETIWRVFTGEGQDLIINFQP